MFLTYIIARIILGHRLLSSFLFRIIALVISMITFFICSDIPFNFQKYSTKDLKMIPFFISYSDIFSLCSSDA